MPQTGESPLSALRRSQKPEDTSGKYKSYRDMPEGQREKFLSKLTNGQPNGSLARHRILNTIEQDPGSADNFLRKAGMMADSGPGGSAAGTVPGKNKSKSSVVDNVASKDGTGPPMPPIDPRMMQSAGVPGGDQATPAVDPAAAAQGGSGMGMNIARITALIASLGGIEVVRQGLKASGSPKLAAIADGKINWQQAMGDPELQQYMNTMVKAKGTGNTAVGMPISRDIGPAATAPMPPTASTPEAAMQLQQPQRNLALDYNIGQAVAGQPPLAEGALQLDNPMTQGAPQLQDMRAPQLQDSTSGPTIEVPPTGAQEADMDARWKAILGDVPMMQAPKVKPAMPRVR